MRLFIIIAFLFLSVMCFSQDKTIETEIVSPNLFDISIIRTFPDSFPDISVIFQAKNRYGKPLWLVPKDQIQVKENGFSCEVKRLINIAKDDPLKISLVLDHSGSMIDNPLQMPEGAETLQDEYFEGKLPKGYIMPIDYAKKALLDFFGDREVLEDSILFVGFSATVDNIPPLTNNLSVFKKLLKNVEPSGATAFYDALYASIENLKCQSSTPVVIALTDGQDNSSKHTAEEVIKLALERKTPIYIIGLGNVHSSSLEYITEETGGFYYYTNDPSTLSTIYAYIKEQVRSIYQLDYTSDTNLIDQTRIINFSFLNDTLNFSDNNTTYNLPTDAIDHINKKEAARKKREQEYLDDERTKEILLYTAGGLALVLLGVGSFIVARRVKSKNTLEFISISPNPFSDSTNISYNIPANTLNAKVTIRNLSGNIIKEEKLLISSSLTLIELNDLSTGTYLFTIETEKGNTKTLKAVKS